MEIVEVSSVIAAVGKFDASIWRAPSPDPNYAENDAKRQAWFDKIKNKKNWKGRILVWIDEADFADCDQASIHFTGGSLEIVGNKPGKLRVWSAGYYTHIGA